MSYPLPSDLFTAKYTAKNLDSTQSPWLSNHSMTILNLSAQQLRRAAGIKDQIASLEKKLSQILGAPTQNNSTPKKGRKMSAAGRARIAAAARARWAKVKGRKSPAKPVGKARRKMSAAARAKIAAAARARWKKAKAAGKKTL
jgi:hypothetical protein